MKYYKFLISNQASEKDVKELLAMLESYFKTHDDPEQMQINLDGAHWIGERIPECSIIIKHKDEVVGSTFIMPCTKEIMKKFVSKEINEAELGEEIKNKVSYENMDAIYLCSVFVKPEHRNKGLALKGTLTSIEKISKKAHKEIESLFYWAYSEEGKRLANKVAKSVKLHLYARPA